MDLALAVSLAFAAASTGGQLRFTVSALLARSCVQALSCYDLHRYHSLIPAVGASLTLPALAGLVDGSVGPWAAAAAAIGIVQLMARWILGR